MMKKSLLFLSLVSAPAFAQMSPLDSAYQAQISSIDGSQASRVWDRMNTDYKNKSQCYHRAYAWAYDMKQIYNINSKKIFLYYGRQYREELEDKWGYHVAPIVNVAGEDLVFDKGFIAGDWLIRPLRTSEWKRKFLDRARRKLISKRKEIISEIEELRGDIAHEYERLRGGLGPVRERFTRRRIARKRENMRDLKRELVKLKITDRDVDRQSRLRVSWLEEDIEYYERVRGSFPALSSEEVDDIITQKRAEILEIQNDADKGISFVCRSSTHIEEIDYHLDEEYCFTQEASMFYWSPPSLRLLNYGHTRTPLKSNLNYSDYRRGETYRLTDFDFELLMQSFEQSFKNAEETWPREFRRQERYERAQSEASRKRRRERLRRFFGIED